MKYIAALTVTTDAVAALSRCLTPELSSLQTKRSTVSMKTEENAITLNVAAEDPTALRATLHCLTRLLIVFEKGLEK